MVLGLYWKVSKALQAEIQFDVMKRLRRGQQARAFFMLLCAVQSAECCLPGRADSTIPPSPQEP